MKKLLLTFISIALLLNCGAKKEQSDQAREESQVAKQSRFVVEQLDEPGLERLITQRNGKILVLNVWATWCEPCRQEFPDLVQLSLDYANTNVEIIGLSVDFPDEIDSKIIPLLEDNDVNFKIYVQNFQKMDHLIDSLNEEWSGVIPATFIFNAEGERVAFLLGKRNFQDFQKELENQILRK
jgi:thiol-disulfide isomerase/thioredoxin